MLRVGATSHLAHILAGVSGGDMVEPQQGAMSLPERERRKPSRVLEIQVSSQAKAVSPGDSGVRPPAVGLKEQPALGGISEINPLSLY